VGPKLSASVPGLCKKRAVSCRNQSNYKIHTYITNIFKGYSNKFNNVCSVNQARPEPQKEKKNALFCHPNSIIEFTVKI
jgi:hypothetical protein